MRGFARSLEGLATNGYHLCTVGENFPIGLDARSLLRFYCDAYLTSSQCDVAVTLDAVRFGVCFGIIFIFATRRDNVYFSSCNVDVSIGIQAFSTIAFGKERHFSTRHLQLVALHGSCTGNVFFLCVVVCFAKCRGSEFTSFHEEVALHFHGFSCFAIGYSPNHTIFENELTVLLVCFRLGLAHINTTSSSYCIQGSTLNLEILLHMESICFVRRSFDSAARVVQHCVFIALVGVLHCSVDFERTHARESGMSMHEESSLVGVFSIVLATQTVGQRVHASLSQCHFDGFPILNVDGCTVGIRQIQTAQH